MKKGFLNKNVFMEKKIFLWEFTEKPNIQGLGKKGDGVFEGGLMCQCTL